jgi:hypothetical protein
MGRRGSPELVALDLDGTVFDGDLTIAPRVVEAVRRTLGANVAVTLVTGRMYVATAPFARLLGVVGPVVCYQGAAVYDAPSGTRLQEVPLASEVALKIVRAARAEGYHVQLYRDDRYYVEEHNRFSALYARLAGVEPLVVASLEETFAHSGATKCNVVTDPERTERCAALLREVCGDDAYVTRSNPEFVEAMNPHVDKGTALRFVAQRLGVPLERVLAIGDSYNDLPLLQAAGIGVAMGSAPSELKAVADAVVGDVAHDGVAEALERFVPLSVGA